MISIITINFNNYQGLKKTLKSINSQNNNKFEHLVIDGKSTDGSINFIKKYIKKKNYIIENDKGIYDAMNKGINLSKYKYVLFLNSGDIFFNKNVISTYISNIKSDIDLIFGNLNIHQNKKIVRKYISRDLNIQNLSYGFMPATPTILFKKHLFAKIGLFSLDYKIASDFDWLVRLMNSYRPKFINLNMLMVSMEDGGISNKNIFSKLIINYEIFRSLKKHNFRTNIVNIFIYKNLIKIMELIKK